MSPGGTLLLLFGGPTPQPPAVPCAIGLRQFLFFLRRAPIVVPASLFGAINAYWSANGLTSTASTPTSAGPLSAELAQPGTIQPFARMTTVATKPFWNFSKNYWEWQWVQFAVYGSGEADARVRGEAVRDAMDAVMSNPALLTMTPGQVAGCWRETGPMVSKCVGTNIPGGATYQAILKYRFQVNRTRP